MKSEPRTQTRPGGGVPGSEITSGGCEFASAAPCGQAVGRGTAALEAAAGKGMAEPPEAPAQAIISQNEFLPDASIQYYDLAKTVGAINMWMSDAVKTVISNHKRRSLCPAVLQNKRAPATSQHFSKAELIEQISILMNATTS
jgi:hypothetical protein